MFRADVAPGWDLSVWRTVARQAWCAQVPPEALDWSGDAQASLLPAAALDALPAQNERLSVPASFLPLAAAVLCHRDPRRHGLLYRLLWRIGHGERALLRRATDPDVHLAGTLAKAVGRDTHKMKAFVRFRQIPAAQDAYVSWFEPEHRIVDRIAPFFVRRFAGMRWAILTPYRSLRWDGQALWVGDGGQRDEVPGDDAHEDLWRTYYAHIFNPARLNPRMMQQEMPQKYWKHLPEAHLLPTLIREAGSRVRDMAERAPQPPRRRIAAPRDKPGERSAQ